MTGTCSDPECTADAAHETRSETSDWAPVCDHHAIKSYQAGLAVRSQDGTPLTDGGTHRPDGMSVGKAWDRKAQENIHTWGVQHPEEILSAIVEEVGEIEQAYLEATHETQDPGRVEDEIDDLGPLLFQLVESLRDHPHAFDPLPTAEEVGDA